MVILALPAAPGPPPCRRPAIRGTAKTALPTMSNTSSTSPATIRGRRPLRRGVAEAKAGDIALPGAPAALAGHCTGIVLIWELATVSGASGLADRIED